MSLLTNWGYTLTEVNELPDMLERDEFNQFTANKYAGDARITSNISAACSAIRNYCNWHIYPIEDCKLESTFYDNRITEVFGGVLIQLPASHVTEITSIEIGGAAHTTYVLEPNGILRLYNVCWNGVYRHTPIVVEYKAGVPEALMGSVKELIAHQVVHAMAGTSGVQSETAGGVSITYNAAWINSTRATDLSSNNKEVIMPYRVQGVF